MHRYLYRNRSLFRTALCIGAAIVPGTASVLAQNVPDERPVRTEPAVEDSDIVVTGSRIGRGNEAAATPVQVLTAQDISQQGQTNVSTILNELPAAGPSGFSSSGANAQDFFQGGVATVDLRGLGSDRTLVLVNGRRYVSGVQNASLVDLNTIPADMVERIEVTTGGASAIYGSDAIAGVVNLVLKKKYEGVSVNSQAGISDEGDGRQFQLSLLGGGSFAGGRGNAQFYAGYDTVDAIRGTARSISRQRVAATDITRPDLALRGAAAASGLVNESGLFYPTSTSYLAAPNKQVVLPDGSVAPFNRAIHGFDTQPYKRLTTDTERLVTAATLGYDLTSNVRLFAEANFAKTKTFTQLEPVFVASGLVNIGVGPDAIPFSIPTSNPFMPAALRALVPAGRTEIGFGRYFSEFGGRGIDYTRETVRLAGGFDGTLTLPFSEKPWDWNVYLSYGRTDVDQQFSGGYDIARLYESQRVESNGAGGFRCANAAARAQGCIPVNLFTGTRLTSQEIQYLSSDPSAKAVLEQKVAAGSMSGELFRLPAGPFKMAMGFEVREEKSAFNPSESFEQGTSGIFQTSAISGKFNVKEVFAEVNFPLLADLPFVKLLEFQGAFRYAHYSTVGGTQAWNFGGSYKPISDLRFRALYAGAVRAPNIGELFQAPTLNTASVFDPCLGGGRLSGLDPAIAAQRKANCLATPGITTAFNPLQPSSIFSFAGSNSKLKEEVARTLTVGAVYTPSFIPGLTLMVDYYRIRISDAISDIPLQTTLDQCANTKDPFFCNQITRDPASGNIMRVDQTLQNAANLKVSGIDVEARYRLPLSNLGISSNGQLTFGVNYSYLREFKTTPFVGGDPIVTKGAAGFPEHKANVRVSYSDGPINISLEERYIGSILRLPDQSFELNRVPAFFYTDAQIRFDVREKFTVYFGANNLFDKKPPFIPLPYTNATPGTNTATAAYDVIGRYLYTGVSMRF